MSAIDTLYRELILEHYRSPRHEGRLDAPSAAVDQDNPLCGDRIHLEIHVAEGRLAAIAHSGDGCSISRASASMMAEVATGLETDTALDLVEHFRLVMHGTDMPDEDRLGDAVALEGVAKFPARVKCALLGWMALKDAIQTHDEGRAS